MLYQVEKYLQSEAFIKEASRLYGSREGTLPKRRARYAKLAARHEARFGDVKGERFFFSAPGRTEIGGNHTDHNRGCVLAAAVNLDTVAFVTKTADDQIVVDSEGFPPITVSLSDLSVRERDYGTTKALIRGTAAVLQEMGKKIGGFRATVTSNVLRGSGLSSSAAFEVLMAAILDGLYNGFTLDSKTRAIIAQRVENVHFGKPCGLMDQMASSVGGMVAIDFGPDDPEVQTVSYDFDAAGYALCVVNTGGSHGDLTDDYAAIRAEMEAVAECFGKTVLREVKKEMFEAEISRLRPVVGERAILRAMHFYDENERVTEQIAAIRKNDLPAFFDAVNRSGNSSWEMLQNVYARPTEEQMALGIELSRRFLAGAGAARVHGGGFAGTIQAYIPAKRLAEYRLYMESVFGEGCVQPLRVRPDGAVMMPVEA